MKNKREKDMKNRFADTGKSYAGYFLRFVFCLVLTAAASLAQAQNRNQVSGKVTDTAGEPLIGATVVVVEHDLDFIANADYVIDMGPHGGKDGGRIVACGTPAEIAANPESITGRYLVL